LYEAKFWFDGVVETKIRNQVAAGDTGLKRKIDDVEMRLEFFFDELEGKLNVHTGFVLTQLRLEIGNDRLTKEQSKGR